MNIQPRALKILFLFFLLTSCHKHKVSKVEPQLEGNWKHYKSKTEVLWIKISSSSKGDQEWYINGKFDHKSSTRNWFVKNGKLELARISGVGDIFSIDQEPTVSPNHFIHEFDTVAAGQSYMILAGHYFVNSN